MTGIGGMSAGSAADRGRRRAALVGGLCGLSAGTSWIGKGGAILLAGVQPPLLFEVAPLLMAVAVWGLAQQLPPARGRAPGCLAAGLGAAAAVPVLLGTAIPLPSSLTGTGMAVSHLAVLAGLAAVGVELRRQQGRILPLVLTVGTVPAVLVGGGLAALLGDRALELPIVALGICWVALGLQLVRSTPSGTTSLVSG